MVSENFLYPLVVFEIDVLVNANELAVVGGGGGGWGQGRESEKKLNQFSCMGIETIKVVNSCLFQMYLLMNLCN